MNNTIGNEPDCHPSQCKSNNNHERENASEFVFWDLETFYDLENSISWIKNGNYKKVVLQIPDEYLCHSSELSSRISCKAQCDAFILADTSYSPCCVDEVACERVQADCIIHYGNACLSKNSRLPVYYVFGYEPIDSSLCAQKITEQFQKDENLIIFYNLQFHNIIDQLKIHLGHMTNIVWSQLENKNFNSFNNENDSNSSQSNCNSKKKFTGFYWTLAADKKIEEFKILYIGKECPQLFNLAMYFSNLEIWTYHPAYHLRKKPSIISRELNKRFYLIEKAKSATIFGIIIGTLVVMNYLDILSYLKKIIRNAGKKYYTFVFGKLNEPKLNNFSEIDVFILISCPENSLKSYKEYYKPIITPFEAEMALIENKQWSSFYSTDFQTILDNLKMSSNPSDNVDNVTHPITNTIDNVDNVTHPITNTIAKKTNNEVIKPITASTTFIEKTFKGLQLSMKKSAHKAMQGLNGIASQYENIVEDITNNHSSSQSNHCNCNNSNQNNIPPILQ